MTILCSNPFCKRTSPGDGPTCRWHVRNYGSEEEPKNVTLCNACKINFDQGKYCPYCVQIYREKDPDSFDGKEWMGCGNKNCRRWVHVDCEAAASSRILIGSYQCPSCRENSEINERKRIGRHNAADRLGFEKSPDRFEKAIVKADFVNGGAATSAENDGDSDESLEAPRFQESSSQRLEKVPRVDLSKLQTSSLRRYKRVYKLKEPSSGCKEDLRLAVAQHFAKQQVVSEEDIIQSLYRVFLRRHRQDADAHHQRISRSSTNSK